ncbi:MAG: hypothetical protein KAG19_07540 [Methylococcales bacterium]|nr:hypothetical protein [Methylococcales bacterium]
MSKLLFSLRGVPADEATEIMDLLDENNINFYETSSGNWGVSMPALWLVNNDDFEVAENLLNQYHYDRAISQREIYTQLKKEGKQETTLSAFLKKPMLFIIYMVAIVFMLYLSVGLLNDFGLSF